MSKMTTAQAYRCQVSEMWRTRRPGRMEYEIKQLREAAIELLEHARRVHAAEERSPFGLCGQSALLYDGLHKIVSRLYAQESRAKQWRKAAERMAR